MAQSVGHFVKIPILSNADVNEVVENIFPSIRECFPLPLSHKSAHTLIHIE